MLPELFRRLFDYLPTDKLVVYVNRKPYWIYYDSLLCYDMNYMSLKLFIRHCRLQFQEVTTGHSFIFRLNKLDSDSLRNFWETVKLYNYQWDIFSFNLDVRAEYLKPIDKRDWMKLYKKHIRFSNGKPQSLKRGEWLMQYIQRETKSYNSNPEPNVPLEFAPPHVLRKIVKGK